MKLFQDFQGGKMTPGVLMVNWICLLHQYLSCCDCWCRQISSHFLTASTDVQEFLRWQQMRETAQVRWPGSSARDVLRAPSAPSSTPERRSRRPSVSGVPSVGTFSHWQPLISRQAERGAFLRAAPQTCLHTQTPPGLRCFTAGLTNEPRCFVPLDVMVGPVRTSPENPELVSASQ